MSVSDAGTCYDRGTNYGLLDDSVFRMTPLSPLTPNRRDFVRSFFLFEIVFFSKYLTHGIVDVIDLIYLIHHTVAPLSPPQFFFASTLRNKQVHRYRSTRRTLYLYYYTNTTILYTINTSSSPSSSSSSSLLLTFLESQGEKSPKKKRDDFILDYKKQP